MLSTIVLLMLDAAEYWFKQCSNMLNTTYIQSDLSREVAALVRMTRR